MSSLRSHPGVIIGALLVATFLIWTLWPRPVLVESTAVKRGPMQVTIEEEGYTRVIDRYVISAPVDGVACRLDLKVGDIVTKDQQLLSIAPLASQVLDPRSKAQAEAQLAAARSALQVAEQQVVVIEEELALADREVKRLEPLLKKGLVSPDRFDHAVSQLNTTRARQRSARFAVDVARYDVVSAQTRLDTSFSVPDNDPVDDSRDSEQVPIHAPIDGQVLKVAHRCEGPVRTGDPLLEVGDPAALEVAVDLLSADAVRITPGMAVAFSRWGGDSILQGKVRTVEPVGYTKTSALGVEEQRVLVISDLVSPREQWTRLGDGYRVDAEFIIWQEDDVLQVPTSSTFRHGEGWAVFVVYQGTARRTPIRIGQRTGQATQVLEGVEEGYRVLMHPGSNISDGTPVIEAP